MGADEWRCGAGWELKQRKVVAAGFCFEKRDGGGAAEILDVSWRSLSERVSFGGGKDRNHKTVHALM